MAAPEVGGWMQGGRAIQCARRSDEIRATVAWLPGLSRRELAATALRASAVADHCRDGEASGLSDVVRALGGGAGC